MRVEDAEERSLTHIQHSLFPTLLCFLVMLLDNVQIKWSAFHLVGDTAVHKTFPARQSWSTGSDSTKGISPMGAYRLVQVSHKNSCSSAEVDSLFESSAILFPPTAEHR